METKSRKEKIIYSSLLFLVCFNILAWIVVWDLSKPALLKVDFFDVGQGDAILITLPKGQQILIDGGPGATILEKLGEEMPFWDRTIDLIILTHPEHDHLAGLLEVLRRYEVKNIMWTGVKKDTAENKEWLKLIEEEKAVIRFASAGQRIIGGKATLEIIYPFTVIAKESTNPEDNNVSEGEFTNTNNTSTVSQLVYGNNNFLFTGDIAQSVEKKIINRGTAIDADVLKISHHGSKGSSSEEFISRVSPSVVVISVGKDNQYGHPASETLETLKKFAIRVLRTDIDGDIEMTSNGSNILIDGNY